MALYHHSTSWHQHHQPPWVPHNLCLLQAFLLDNIVLLHHFSNYEQLLSPSFSFFLFANSAFPQPVSSMITHRITFEVILNHENMVVLFFIITVSCSPDLPFPLLFFPRWLPCFFSNSSIIYCIDFFTLYLSQNSSEKTHWFCLAFSPSPIFSLLYSSQNPKEKQLAFLQQLVWRISHARKHIQFSLLWRILI